MSDRIDQEGRASFVQTLPRKVTELRATLGTLVADPKSQRMRDELRRRLHALYTLTRSYSLPALSDGLREGLAHLDATRGASVLTQRDLETLADLLATLPSLAQRDLPDQPELFTRRRDKALAASSAVAVAAEPAAPPQPTESGPVLRAPVALRSDRPTVPGGAEAPAVANVRDTAPDPSVPEGGQASAPGASIHPVPLGVLVVGGPGIVREVRRVLPAEADVTPVRTMADAVSAARDTAPDVILAEVAAPADGLGLLAALRGDPLTDFLPVVLLAAPNDGVDADGARAQGATDLLSLPLDLERLRTAIDRASQGLLQHSLPPPSFGELTLEELTRTLQEEIRRGILGAAGAAAGGARVSLGQGSEVLAATWEAIARVRDVVERRTRGRVKFELPAAPLGLGGAHMLTLADDEGTAREAPAGEDDPLPGRRALVVDDDPGVVWFFAGLLREAGMEVVECADGFEALREARKARPDLVISDILMPGLDGFALCRAIRRDVALRQTPVILLSWKEDLLVRMRELGAQAQGFLRKESRGEAILSRVRAVLRPRVQLLRRIEHLGDGVELRGRVDRVGVIALVESAARVLGDATLTVTDSFSVTEFDLRGGRLTSVVRTAQDGSLARGEGALLQALGATSARFSLRRADHAVRANVQGELDKLLAGGAALITALEDSVSGSALLEVASLDLDSDGALSYARSLPEAMRSLVERLAKGESPRHMVLNEGVAPHELEPVLVELARRGAIRNVRGPHGEDLVAPRFAAANVGEGHPSRPASQMPRAESGEMPAVLRVPPPPALPQDLAREAAPPPEPATTATTAAAPEVFSIESIERPAPKLDRVPSDAPRSRKSISGSGWTPPTTVDEASQPGFGLEPHEDSLADALLRELKDPEGGASKGASDAKAGAAPPAERAKPAEAKALEREGAKPAETKAAETKPEAAKPEAKALEAKALAETKPAEAESRSAPAEAAEPEAVNPELSEGDLFPDAVKPKAPSTDTDAHDDVPELAEEETEAELSSDDLLKAAASAPGLPLEGVELDARGLPRRRPSSELPALSGPLFDPHEPARAATDDSPSSSIIVDEAAIGGKVEVFEAPKKKPEGAKGRGSQRDTSPPPTSTSKQSPSSSGGRVLWLAVGVLVLGAVSYFGMRLVLETMQPSPTPAVHGAQDVVGAAATEDAVAATPDAGAALAAPNGAAAQGEDAAAALDATANANAGEDAAAVALTPDAAGVSYEDPAAFLDGGTLPEGRGLLVLEAPAGSDLEIAVNQTPVGPLPAVVPLPAGMSTVRYRSHGTTGFRFVPVVAGRAARVELRGE